MHCNFVRMHAGETGKPIELVNLLDSKPDGYMARLQYTTLGIDGNYVYLSSAHNEFGGSQAYVFGKTYIYTLFKMLNKHINVLIANMNFY